MVTVSIQPPLVKMFKLTLLFLTLGTGYDKLFADSTPVIVDITKWDFDQYDQGWKMGVCAQDPTNGNVPIAWSWFGHQKPTNIRPKCEGKTTPSTVPGTSTTLAPPKDYFWWTQLRDGQSSNFVYANITLKSGSYIKFKVAVDEIRNESYTPSGVAGATITVNVKSMSDNPCQQTARNLTTFHLPVSSGWKNLPEFRFTQEEPNVVLILTAYADIPQSNMLDQWLEIAIDDFVYVSEPGYNFTTRFPTSSTPLTVPTTTATLAPATTTAGSSPLKALIFSVILSTMLSVAHSIIL